MRYREDNYKITVDSGYVYVHIKVTNDDYLVVNPTMKEAVRLIVDETAKITFCSSMQKDKILEVASSSEEGCNMKLKFAIPTGKTVTTSDQFTIELDFGEAPADYAKDSSVKDGNDTAISVTKDVQGKVGAKDSSDAEEPSTLFAWFRRLYQNIRSVYNNVYDAQNVKSAVSEAASANTKIGTSSDGESAGTVFGNIKSVWNVLDGKVGSTSSGTIASNVDDISTKIGTVSSGQSVYADMAKLTTLNTNTEAIELKIQDTFLKFDYTETSVMPAAINGNTSYGGSISSSDFIIESISPSTTPSNYQVGEVIKYTGTSSLTSTSVVSSLDNTTSCVSLDNTYKIVGVNSYITCKTGYYYRIKGLISVTGTSPAPTVTVIVYEELPESIASGIGDISSVLEEIQSGSMPVIEDGLAKLGTNPLATNTEILNTVNQNDNNISALINNTLTVNMVTTGVQSMLAEDLHVIQDDEGLEGDPLVVNPNVLYYLENDREDDLYIEFPFISSPTTIKEFHFLFHQPSVQISFGNIPQDNEDPHIIPSKAICWQLGLPPQLSSGQDFYEVGILNGIGLWMSYSATNN